MMVHGPIGPSDQNDSPDNVDASFLDTASSDASGTDPDANIPPAEPAPTGGGAPVPVTPHRRGSPNPLKVKVGKKGASAGN